MSRDPKPNTAKPQETTKVNSKSPKRTETPSRQETTEVKNQKLQKAPPKRLRSNGARNPGPVARSPQRSLPWLPWPVPQVLGCRAVGFGARALGFQFRA